jgi:hypothetical protein
MIKYVFPNARGNPKRRLNVSLRVEKYRDWIDNFDGVEIPGNFYVKSKTLVLPPPDLYTRETEHPKDYFYSLHTEYIRGYEAEETNIPVRNPKAKKKIPILDWYDKSWIDRVMYPSIRNSVLGIGLNPYIIELHPPDKTDKGFIVDVDKFIDGINYLKEKLRAESINPQLFLIENRNLRHTLISNINSLAAFKNSRQDKSNIFITLDFGQLFRVEVPKFHNPDDELEGILNRLEENNLHEVIRGFHFYGITKNNTTRRSSHMAPVGISGDINWGPIVNWMYVFSHPASPSTSESC